MQASSIDKNLDERNEVGKTNANGGKIMLPIGTTGLSARTRACGYILRVKPFRGATVSNIIVLTRCHPLFRVLDS